MFRLILPLTLLGAPGAVLASTLPKFDIESTCRAALPSDLGDNSGGKQESYKKCMRGELSARKEAETALRGAAAADRKICLEEAGSIYPSYIELLVCLELRQTPTQETAAGSRRRGR